jgi:hypothetical protein
VGGVSIFPGKHGGRSKNPSSVVRACAQGSWMVFDVRLREFEGGGKIYWALMPLGERSVGSEAEAAVFRNSKK